MLTITERTVTLTEVEVLMNPLERVMGLKEAKDLVESYQFGQGSRHTLVATSECGRFRLSVDVGQDVFTHAQNNRKLQAIKDLRTLSEEAFMRVNGFRF